MKALLLVAPLALLAGALAPAADQEPDVQVVATHVAGNVHMLVGQGGNIGISAGEDGILMVDDQFANLEEKIRAAIATIAEGAPRWLVNTHWHGDHTGGNAAFGRDAVLIAHDNVRARMETGGGRGPASPKEALPVLTFGTHVTLHVNGEEVQVTHVPSAHTDGDAVLYFTESGVAHVGDLFFNGMFPFVDLQSGGSVSGMLDAVDVLLERLPEGTKIIPGHGPLADRAALDSYRKMLATSMRLVSGRIEEGMDESAAVAAGMPAEYAAWSWSFVSTERWLQTVYRELASEAAGD
jgi:glyoxylase-like metal-dependent hydrolase (beta-lactamase superfamily II)